MRYAKNRTLKATPYSDVKVGDLVQVVNGYLPTYGLCGNVTRLGDAGGIQLLTVQFPNFLTQLTFTRACVELVKDLESHSTGSLTV